MDVNPLISLVNIAFTVYIYIIIARVILSFVKHDPQQVVIKFIYEVTTPIMRPFQKLIPSAGGIDFSPIIIVLALELARKLIINILLVIF